jgi:hypothetical protein
MFLKATNQPALGTIVRIDLELPSGSVIELQGSIVKHVVDPQRGTGVDLKLEALPTKSVWMIESALAAENKVRAQTGAEPAETSVATAAPARATTITDGEDVAAAEEDLIRALEAEAESLRKLNPFLVLGVGYETTDADVRAAFGELTKRYHPDRFARYQSAKLRQIAAEIFILIRDAYRRLADDKSRQQVVATLGPRAAAKPSPGAARGAAPTVPAPPRLPSPNVARVAVPPHKVSTHDIPTAPRLSTHDVPTKSNPHDAPTSQSGKPAELAGTELAKGDPLAVPVESAPRVRPPQPTPQPMPALAATDKPPANKPTVTTADGTDTTAVETLLEEGKLDDALAGYRILTKKHPQDKGLRAGIELCEGLRALAARDRMEAAQRFEAALELDPSNEHAARELAEMRRHATNERKGLLSRLMGKKEPPP